MREYGDRAQRMRDHRASRLDRARVQFSVGQIFRHKVYGYRGVVYGWDPKCEREPQWAAAMKVEAEQVSHEPTPITLSVRSTVMLTTWCHI